MSNILLSGQIDSSINGSSMPHHSQSASNPQGWQRVAGGRSAAETSGKWSGEFRASWRDATVLRPLRGRLEIGGWRPGGVAALNHRLFSDKPSACGMADPKTNPITSLNAASAFCLHTQRQRRGASEFTSEVTWQEFSLGFFHSSFGGWFSRVLDRIFAQVDLIK